MYWYDLQYILKPQKKIRNDCIEWHIFPDFALTMAMIFSIL